MASRNAMLFLIFVGLSICTFTMCQKPQYNQGQGLYSIYCVNCHMEDGSGLAKLIPPLAGSDYLENADVETLVCLIMQGAEGGIVVNGTQYHEPMPGFSNLKPAELSNLINYIKTGFGNKMETVDPQDVRAAYETCR